MGGLGAGAGMGRADQQSSVLQAVAPLSSTGNITGLGLDRRGFNQVRFLINVGVVTAGTHTPKVQQSSDDGSADAYADATAGEYGVVTRAAISEAGIYEMVVDCRNMERYVRLFCTSASANMLIGVVAVLEHPTSLPQ